MCSYIVCIRVYQGSILLLDYPFKYYAMFSLSLIMTIVLKTILSDISMLPQLFFKCLFAWNIFSLPSFSVCVDHLLWSGSWSLVDSLSMGHIFFIPSITLHFWIGAFNLFTFKVIIDRFFLIGHFFKCYSITVVCISPPPPPLIPAKPNSLPCFHPPPWFCPCILYSK